MILVVEASRTGCYFSWLTRGTAGILNPQITRSHLQYSRLKRCLRFSSSHYTFSPNLFPSVQNLPHIGHFLIFIWLNFGLKMLAELFIYGWSGICSFNLIFLSPHPPFQTIFLVTTRETKHVLYRLYSLWPALTHFFKHFLEPGCLRLLEAPLLMSFP